MSDVEDNWMKSYFNFKQNLIVLQVRVREEMDVYTSSLMWKMDT
jgi:hypothetical protein